MKNYLALLLLLFSLVGLSQGEMTNKFESGDWGYTEIKSDFDGDYRIAVTLGTGQFPYTDPMLLIREKDSSIVILITEVANGYAGDYQIKLKFDGDSKIYEYNALVSASNEVWFLGIDYDTTLEITDKLKKHSSLSVRLSQGYGNSNDYYFSLRGSTATINRLHIENYSKGYY